MKRVWLILFILAIVYFIFLIRQDIINNLDLAKQLKSATQSASSEESRYQELKDRLKRLKTEAYVEQLARTRLGLVKQGETPYKVIGGRKE